MKGITRNVLLGSLVFMLFVMMTTPSTLEVERMSVFYHPRQSTTESSMIPSNVAVEGTVIDNYANVSYLLVFNNSDSETASEICWNFDLQDGIRLSNASVLLQNTTYWGRIMPEREAISMYNESVASNMSAVLVVRTYSGYRICFNLENGSIAIIGVYVEGLLTRKLGMYSLDLPISKGIPIEANVHLDLTILSSYGTLAGYSVGGLPSFTATDLVNGIHIEYSTSDATRIEQIRIAYALNRQMGGSQLLTYTNGTDNFFVYLLAPSITEITNRSSRQYVFVLDKSGSMSGIKISQAKSAFNSMVQTLLSNDVFSIIAFDSDIDTLWPEPMSASVANINLAQTWVNEINAGDMTNFHGAAITGLNMMQPGENVKVMFILSDGLPTAGTILDTAGILSAIGSANELDVSISTVAFGSDADENLMANIPAQNNGFFAFIQPTEQAADEIMSFYQEFATPIASSYSIEFSGTLDLNTLVPLENSPFFNGSEVIVAGRYGSSMSVSTTIDYVAGTETYSNYAGAASSEKRHIERIWAQHRISYLLRCIQLEGESQSLRDEVINIGMYYGIIVQGYTALILTAYDVNVENNRFPEATATFFAGIPKSNSNLTTSLTITIAGSILVVVTILILKRRSSGQQKS